LIPLDDLKIELSNGKVINRPRIDVYTSAVTSNVNWIALMANAVKLANDADETPSQNYLKKHYAENPSLDRIFGLPGAVLEGTGMSDYIPNTDKWWNSTNLTEDLAEIYLSRVSNSWTIDENGRLVFTESRGVYEYLLGKTDLVTQNIDSTWRFLDSDDYYDWFGGLLGAAKYLGANPDTGIVDIRNPNNYISRTLEEEIEFEIRSMILNPKYRDELLKTSAGWLAYAEKYENIIGFAITSPGSVSSNMFDALANNLLNPPFSVNSDFSSVAYQKGLWKGDPALVQALVDNYIKTVIQYGVACCHHTCANIKFNELLAQASSLSNDDINKFFKELESSTLIKYDSSRVLSDRFNQGSANEEINKVYNTSQSKSQYSPNSQNSVDIGAFANSMKKSGENGEVGADGKSGNPSPSSDGESGSLDTQGDGKSYEVNQDQSSNNSSEDSGVSAVFIAMVLAVIALFVLGYVRNKSA